MYFYMMWSINNHLSVNILPLSVKDFLLYFNLARIRSILSSRFCILISMASILTSFLFFITTFLADWMMSSSITLTWNTRVQCHFYDMMYSQRTKLTYIQAATAPVLSIGGQSQLLFWEEGVEEKDSSRASDLVEDSLHQLVPVQLRTE